ncbi:Carbamoyl-phosphate synthase small chain [Bienertia sinuspersici]
MAPWTGMQVKVPAKFILGELDVTYSFPLMKDYMHKGGFKRDVPLLDGVVVMEGAAHFINQERPDEINNYILDFFDKF